MVGEARSGELLEIYGRFTCLLSEMDESTEVLMRFLLPACLDGLKLPSYALFDFCLLPGPAATGYFFLATPISL